VSIVAATWLVQDPCVDRPFDGAEYALAVRARDGDRQAQRAIYELYAPRVRRFVIDLLRDREAASDALQDTFVRVFQRIGSVEDPARLVGWVFGIARRVCLEQRRRESRRAQAAPLPEGPGEVAHQGLSPEAAYALAESSALLDRALDRLGPDRRAVLLMRCDHMLSYEEIATAMGFSLAKVKIEIFRARAALREALEGEGAR
jgi:RNA polymerase sigma-70 factor (ECF subfamily)